MGNPDLESPLLGVPAADSNGATQDDPPPCGADQPADEQPGDPGGDCLQGDVRLNQATAALASTIIGAGIMALPRAFATLGLVVGGGLLLLVFALSLFTAAALVKAAQDTRRWTYSELTRSQFGDVGAALLRLSIVTNNAGSMIIYLIILGDVLCGVAPHYSGLITNLLGVHDPSVFYASRPFVMAVLCAVALGPLVSLRDLRRLAPMSTLSVAVAAGFVASVVGLSGLAVRAGTVGDFHWLPTKEMLGPTPAKVAVKLLAVLPVITMSFVCHYNLLPVARNLQCFTERRMMMVIRRAVTICTVLFTAVAASGVVLFGSSTQDNILLNLNPEEIGTLLSPTGAAVLCFLIRLGYCICLMSTFAMLNWALRETVTKTLFTVAMLPGPGFFALSYAIVAVELGISILFPSVWTAMSLTGATAAVFLAYILPGALIVRVDKSSAVSRALGALCVVMGAVMGCVGVFDTLFPQA